MTRLTDWEAGLNATLDEWAALPFIWGSADCARFVAACIKAQTGDDPMTGQRGYTSETGAHRLMAKVGGLVAYMDARFEQVPPSLARRGDAVMVDGSLGICVGATAAMVGETGLVYRARPDWSHSWAVR